MVAIKKVVCAVSGGVDSSVAATILKRKGFQVHGLFMKNWDKTDETGICTQDQDREDAQYVCKKLGIPFSEVNFVKEYWNDVFCQMVEGYEKGTTPNPDVLCNRHIKFGAMFRHATEVLGADAVATGHYARNSYGQFLENCHPEKPASLLLAPDPVKDQTLFLAQISQASLRRTMFPVGGYMKTKVKEIAKAEGFDRIVKKKESMGICFIGTRNFRDFIEEYIVPKPGRFLNVDTGEEVGRHKGTHYWTVGQRAHLGGLAKAFFVQRVDPVTQDIWVAAGTNHPALFTTSMSTASPHWIGQPPEALVSSGTLSCQFKFQHIHPKIACQVKAKDDGGLEVEIERPLRAITPGQFAVFYQGLECLGSAKIVNPGPSLMEGGTEETVNNLKAFT